MKIDYTLYKSLFQGIVSKYKTLFAFILVLFFTIYPRIQTYFLPVADKLAKKDVYSKIANESKDYIKSLYKGNISVAEQDKFAEEEYKKRLKNKSDIIKNIQDKIKEKKSLWQDNANQTYLLEFDPYYLYRYTKNLLDKGTISDEIRDGKLYDLHSYAPEGKFIIPSFIIYIGFFFHKLFTLFNKDISLLDTLFIVPLILSILISIAVFFFVKRIFGLFEAFLSVFVITLMPMFLSRSMCGWYDTDCLNLLLPFLSVFLFYFALQQRSLARSIWFVCLSSLCIGIFALSWNGWWYFFYVVLAGTLLYVLNTAERYFKDKDKDSGIELKRILLFLVFFIGLSILFIVIITWPQRLMQLVHEPSSVFKSVYAKQSITTSIWPNTFLTVAELRETELPNIVFLAGNPFIFFISIFGLFLLIKPRLVWDQRIQYLGFVFTIWSILTVFAALRAVRFTLLLAVPQGICFAVAIRYIIDMLFMVIKPYSFYKRILAKFLVFAALLLFMSLMALERFSIARNVYPVLDDDYVAVLNKIKNNSPANTIVNSWWDFGTWYSAIGERRVIFDGATQHTAMAFWMGRVLMADDEAEALGILRMINCSSNKAFETLKSYGFSDIDAFLLLKKIIVLEKEEAKGVLQEALSIEKADELLNYTHGDTPPAYFIVDKHMVDIVNALALLGNWSAEKVFIWQTAHSERKQKAMQDIETKLGYEVNKTAILYDEAKVLSNKDLKNWASDIVRFYSSLSNGIKEERVVLFDNDVFVELNSFNARIKTPAVDGWKRPHSLIYPNEGGFKEIVYEDAEIPFTILLISDNDAYKNLVLDKKLAKSMLVRLLFLKGHGLKYFKFLFSEKKEGFGDINVWEIDWQGRQKNSFPLNK